MKIIRDNQEIEIITYLKSTKEATKFRHFKGKEYNIVSMGKDCETLEEVVVYRGLYDDNPIWIRKKDDFFSEVDHQKYPNIKQKYRFEIVE